MTPGVATTLPNGAHLRPFPEPIMSRALRLVAAFTLTSLPAIASAATYTVGSGGTYDYTSIQDAIDGASSGNTINVYAGTYAEAIDFDGKNLTVQSVSGYGTTVINASSTGATYAVTFDDYEGANAKLIGFTIPKQWRPGHLYRVFRAHPGRPVPLIPDLKG